MRRLVRGLEPWAPLLLILCVLVAPSGCKRKKKRVALEPIVQSGALATMLDVADPRAQVQLTKGFYDVESNAWRWTADTFSASLRPPRFAAEKGAKLVLKLAVPDVVIQKLKSIQLSAAVNGLNLTPEEYTKPGEYTYSRDVPATALAGEAVKVDFK